jgi:N-methylhydantoinase A/oxoprolinase/acetone carboxylase beta subunit
MARDFHFSIDRGGTFTDVFAQVPDGKGGSKFMCVQRCPRTRVAAARGAAFLPLPLAT